MKKALLSIVFLILSAQVLAKNCADRLTDNNWPNDRFKIILKCSLEEVVQGGFDSSYGDTLCFGEKKTQVSNYRNSIFQSVRFYDGNDGSFGDGVAVNSQGKALGDRSTFEKRGSIISISSKYSYFTDSWKNETIVDLKNLEAILNKYEGRLFGYTKVHSSVYRCQVELE